jgi:hypothetical protein
MNTGQRYHQPCCDCASRSAFHIRDQIARERRYAEAEFQAAVANHELAEIKKENIALQSVVADLKRNLALSQDGIRINKEKPHELA